MTREEIRRETQHTMINSGGSRAHGLEDFINMTKQMANEYAKKQRAPLSNVTVQSTAR